MFSYGLGNIRVTSVCPSNIKSPETDITILLACRLTYSFDSLCVVYDQPYIYWVSFLSSMEHRSLGLYLISHVLVTCDYTGASNLALFFIPQGVFV